MHLRSTAAAVLCAATVISTVGMTPAAAAPDGATAPLTTLKDDFNGDGRPDVVISAPEATVNGAERAGCITAVYGSESGLDPAKGTVISRAGENIPGEPVADERFGRGILTSGDIDSDGYADLIMAPGSDAGFTVLWGSAAGLTSGTKVSDLGNLVLWTASGDTGDFNGDGHTDIAVPAHQFHTSGGIAIMYGPFNRAKGSFASTAFRSTWGKDKFRTQDVSAGDVNHDGRTDLIGSGQDMSNPSPGPYRSFVYLGTSGTTGDSGGLTKSSEITWGYEQTLGDLNGDGYQDVVANMHKDGYTQSRTGGWINVTYGGPKGLSTTLKPRKYSQATAGVPGIAEKNDWWGYDVSIGDTDGDGYGDLAVTALNETGTDPAKTSLAGAVTILRGSASGVTTEGAEVITQNTAGVPSASENNDHFGSAIRLVDTNGDGRSELVAGGRGEDGFTGRAWILPGSPAGVTGSGSVSFNGTAFGMPKGRAWYGAYMNG
ncbi:FG-GAP repeat domain-containing protein [Streptomyces sp. NPDC059828]|uniref:FG-GAP repeat domain-containing protein n=1 Tax=Streptomyces sp. NPDC059828 TaxID=3346965 RepID=UPI0036479B01